MKKLVYLLVFVNFSILFAQVPIRVVDTSYGYPVTRNVSVKTLTTTQIQNDKVYLNSKSNAFVKGGKNRVVIPVHLPENTKEWYYTFSASRDEEDVENTLSTFSLMSNLTQYVKSDGSLNESVSKLTPPPGANICDLYVLNEENATLFREKDDFEFSLEGSRENFKSGIVQVKNNNSEMVYIGINNPDNLHGIHVSLEIVAIVETEEFVQETYRIPVYTHYNAIK